MSAYYVTYGDSRLVLAGYPGALAFDYASGPTTMEVSVFTIGDVTSYISAVANGVTSTWTCEPDTYERIYVPESSILILRNETPLYYRALLNPQLLTDYTDGTDTADGRTTTASGLVGADTNFVEIYSEINRFTATGSYQSVNGSQTGQWRPHTISYLRMGLDNEGLGTFSFGSSVSASYQAQGAYNYWSYQTLGASTHFNTGVNFSAFSSYQSAYFRVPKVNQQGQYTATAGVRFGNQEYASTTVYKKPNGGSVSRTQNFTSGSISFTTAIGGTLSIYGKTNIAGMVGGNVSLNGQWSATGIAP